LQAKRKGDFMTPNTKQRDLLRDGFRSEDCESPMDVCQGADLFRYIEIEKANQLLREAIEASPVVLKNSTMDTWRRVKADYGKINPKLYVQSALLICIQPIGGDDE
jgi:hypothetical protein